MDASVEAYVCGTHQRIISPQKKAASTGERYEMSFGLPGYRLKHQFSKDMLQLWDWRNWEQIYALICERKVA
jgi:hypothetical protein